jgi:hypothetical protein
MSEPILTREDLIELFHREADNRELERIRQTDPARYRQILDDNWAAYLAAQEWKEPEDVQTRPREREGREDEKSKEH